MAIISELNCIFQMELNQTHSEPNPSFFQITNRNKSIPHTPSMQLQQLWFIRPSSCSSSTWPIKPFPATLYTDHGLFVVQTSPNSFSFFCFISSTVLQSTFSPVLLLLALSFFSTHVEYSPVARHLECQEFSGVCCFYSPYLGSIEQTRTDATRAHHVGRLSFWLLKCCNSMDVKRCFTHSPYHWSVHS